MLGAASHNTQTEADQLLVVVAALARIVTETLSSLQKAAILNKLMSELTALVRIRVTTSHHVLKC